MRSARLIPYACGAGGQVPGAERAGLDLWQRGLAESLQDAGYDISWACDPEEIHDLPIGARAHAALPEQGTKERRDIVLQHSRLLQQKVAAEVSAGCLPITLGGDHSMALGSVSGLAKATGAHGNIGLIWIDAHADINTPDTSPSQALHGMPVAALLGMGDPEVVALAGERPVLSPQHIVYIGLRDVDPGEKDYIASLNITAFTMEDIRAQGIENILNQAQQIIAGTAVKALSIDLDAFDPADAPSVGTPVPGGLDAAQTLPHLKNFVQKCAFDLVEIAEYNPTLPESDVTTALITKLLGIVLESEMQGDAAAGSI